MRRLKYFVFMLLFFSLCKSTFAGGDCKTTSANAIKDYALSLYDKGEYADAQHEFGKCLLIEPDCSVCEEYLEKLSRLPEAPKAKEIPVAVLEAQAMDECLTFIFDGTKSFDPDGKIVSYDWDFGDGSQGSGPSVIHTYKKSGKYTVTLTVTDDSILQCNKATVTEELNVSGAPEIEIEVAAFSCPDTEVVFNAKVNSPNPNTKPEDLEVTWDFGDGTKSEGLFTTHTYRKGGLYTVKAQVVDTSQPAGCNRAQVESTIKINTTPKANAGRDIITCFPATEPSLQVKFDGTASSDADGDALSYHWDFGDGVTSDLARPIHIYRKSGKYKVRLTVKDNSQSQCDTSEDTIDVILNHPPVADAGKNRACCLNEPVEFDASGSYDPDGDELTYVWDFGDGQTATGKTATHTYTKGGEYKVVLTVSDNFSHSECNSSQSEFTANVEQLPVAVMQIRPYFEEKK